MCSWRRPPTEEVDEGPKFWENLRSSRVVDAEARAGRAGSFKRSFQPRFFQERPHMPVHEVGQTNSCSRACQSQRCGVDDQRTIHGDRRVLINVLHLPAIEAAGHTKIDTGMVCEVFRACLLRATRAERWMRKLKRAGTCCSFLQRKAPPEAPSACTPLRPWLWS